MGCDIHMNYQKIGKKQKRENKLSEILENEPTKLSSRWVFIDDATITDSYGYTYQFCEEYRNYYWFGRMSEVRGDGPRITETGFPDDIDMEAIEYGYNSLDGRYFGDHSHSHIYLDRLLEEEWSEDDKKAFGWFIREDIPKMVKYCEENGLKPNEFRILIGYDN